MLIIVYTDKSIWNCWKCSRNYHQTLSFNKLVMCVNKFGKTKFGVNWLKIFLKIRIHKYKRFQSWSKGSIVYSLLMAAVQVTIITCTLASVSFFIFLDTLNNRVFQLYMHTQFCCKDKRTLRLSFLLLVDFPDDF